jgi:predicted DNA-binding ArsR family transcriptional regulator
MDFGLDFPLQGLMPITKLGDMRVQSHMYTYLSLGWVTQKKHDSFLTACRTPLAKRAKRM